jgi:hypothetical protein
MTRESRRATSLLPHLHSASIGEWTTTLKALQFLNECNRLWGLKKSRRLAGGDAAEAW